MFQKNFIIFSIVVVFLALAFFIGVYSGHNAGFADGIIEGIKRNQASYQEKIDKFFGKTEEPKQIFAYAGKISKIEGNAFFMKIVIPAHNPLEEEQILTKKVIVDNKTVIIKKEPKDQAQYQKELATAQANKLPLPNAYVIKTLTLADLKPNMAITAGSNKNIKESEEFIADNVEVQ